MLRTRGSDICGPVDLGHVERTTYTRILLALPATSTEALRHSLFKVDVEEIGHRACPGDEIGHLQHVLHLNRLDRKLSRQSLSGLAADFDTLFVEMQDDFTNSTLAILLAVESVKVMLPIA